MFDLGAQRGERIGADAPGPPGFAPRPKRLNAIRAFRAAAAVSAIATSPFSVVAPRTKARRFCNSVAGKRLK